MPSPQILDFEALLKPIPGEKPAGESLRYSGVYDAIQEARRSDDALAQGEWKREAKTADWPAVLDTAVDALAKKSKDLQLAVWLVEAAVKRHGFAGLRDGLRLTRELQERFWPTLHPEAEGGDLEFRAAPLEWLNEKLPFSIREIPLTKSGGGDRYSWLRWDESRTVDNLGRQDQEAMAAAVADGKITGGQFDKAVAGTPRADSETLMEDLSQSWTEFELLGRLVEEKFGREAPSLINIRKAIEDCRTLIQAVVRKKREQEPRAGDVAERAPGAAGSEQPDISQSAAVLPGEVGAIDPRDRADALRRLAAVAAFFRRTEPHSPVSYLVQRAVQWGGMPLEEWLHEVIGNEDVLARVRETLGLKPPRAAGE